VILRSEESIFEVLRLAKDLMALADRGEIDAEDDSCRILFAVVRDCAYKIHAEAERERQVHRDRGVMEQQEGCNRRSMRKDN
jgi:hypothetical protein